MQSKFLVDSRENKAEDVKKGVKQSAKEITDKIKQIDTLVTFGKIYKTIKTNRQNETYQIIRRIHFRSK